MEQDYPWENVKKMVFFIPLYSPKYEKGIPLKWEISTTAAP